MPFHGILFVNNIWSKVGDVSQKSGEHATWLTRNQRLWKIWLSSGIIISVSGIRKYQKHVFETTKFSIVVPCFWSLPLSSSHSSPTVRPKPCGSTGSSSKISSHINHLVQMRRSLWYAIGIKLTKSTVFYRENWLRWLPAFQHSSVAWCASYRTGLSHREQCATQLLHRNRH